MEILIAEQNKKLLEIVNIDHLTQLFNRKVFLDEADKLLYRAKNTGRNRIVCVKNTGL